MAESYRDQLQEASFQTLSFEERFSLMVDTEWAKRKNNRLAKLIRRAEFLQSDACIENIEYHADRKLDVITNGTAKEFVTGMVETGCSVTTDGYTVYPLLKDLGYEHERVLSSEPEAEEKFHWVHTIISNAKTFIIGTFHGLDGKHLQAYLDEFCYRFNRRRWHGQLFSRLLSACITGPVLTYAELTL